MQLLQDFFPVLVFFAVYQARDLYWATGALIVAVALQTAITWVRHRKVSTMALMSLVLLVVFAGLARHVSAMTLGPPVAAEPAIATEHRRAPVLIALGAAAILGLMASPLAAQLREAAAVLAAAR